MNYLFPAEIMRLKMRGKEPNCRTCKSYHTGDKAWCRRFKNVPEEVFKLEMYHCEKYRELQKPS